MGERDLSEFNPEHLNRVAALLIELHDYFLPLGVRYQAAADALARVREWHEAPFEVVAGEGEPLSRGLPGEQP